MLGLAEDQVSAYKKLAFIGGKLRKFVASTAPITECALDPCDGIAIQHDDLPSVGSPVDMNGNGTPKQLSKASPKDVGIQFRSEAAPAAAVRSSKEGGFALRFC
jgi:hypothetical protein